MRILHVVPTYWPAVRYGGPIYSVHELCRALAKRGHDVEVMTTNVDGRSNSGVVLGKPVDVQGVRVSYFPSAFGRRFYYSPMMKKRLKERVGEFDLIHLHSVYLWPTWAAARIASQHKIPYIVSPRGMLFRELIKRKSRFVKMLWISLIEKSNLKRACRVHVTSEVEECGLREMSLDLPEIVVIPNGVTLENDADIDNVDAEIVRVASLGPYVLYLGRINWKKGLDRLMEIWNEEMPARLILAGNDEDEYIDVLRKCVSQSALKNVTFINRFVNTADKEYLFQQARVFVLPSYSENFGNTVLEAMIRGVPVVVTEEVGAAHLVKEAGAGLVVSGNNLRGGILELLRDNKQRKLMSENGQVFALKHLSWDAVAGQMETAYKETIRKV